MTLLANKICAARTMRAGTSPFEEFDDELFDDWVHLLESRVGLYIAPERRSFMAAGLRTRMRETGCDSYRQYYLRLVDGAGQAEEWSLLIDSLTVHETCFFRHKSSMSLVANIVIPEVLERSENISVWSVGCSSGEEAYSLAMLIDSYRSAVHGDCFYGVTGTDISRPALKQARSGIYLNRRLADIKPEYQERYCKSVSKRRFAIDSDLRERVCFSYLNLRDVAGVPFAELDLIFCQNLLIYFDREQRVQVADSLAERLRPGGVLVLGPGELVHWKNPHMERLPYDDTLAFRRVSGCIVMQQDKELR